MTREERFEVHAGEGEGGAVKDLSRGKRASAKRDSEDGVKEEANLAGYVERAEVDNTAR